MSSPFVAEIRIFGCNFAPTGWATCDGQVMSISQNTALFSLLGTTFGGDGKSTFALPNLDASAAAAWSSASSTFNGPGYQTGSPNVTLLTTEMPVHTHTMQADNVDTGDSRTPTDAFSLAQTSPGAPYINAATGTMSPFALAIAGGSLPHNNMQPYLTLLFCIALQGVFPPRS